MQGILRHVNFDVVKCVLIASPGFVKDQFFEFMQQQAVKNDCKVLLENKGKFVLVHSSTGFKHSLKGRLKYSCTNFIFYAKLQTLKNLNGTKIFRGFVRPNGGC